ncbi:MAG TPA: hypothetical protein VF832_08925 [Longimicrobiales bacterium]
MRKAHWLVVAALLGGCGNPRLLMQHRLPPGADAFARGFVHALATGDTARAFAALEPTTRTQDAVDALTALSASLRTTPLDSLVSVRTLRSSAQGQQAYSVDYETRSGANWLLFDIVLSQRQPGSGAEAAAPPFSVDRIQIRVMAESLRKTNALTLKGKSPAHYLILLFGAASLGFCLYTLVLIFRTRGVRRWAWALLSLIAVGSLQLNWTTGEAQLQSLALVLLGFAVTRTDAAAPWIVQVGFPVGAALFHSRALLPFRRRSEEPEDRPPAPRSDDAGPPDPPPPG